MQKFNELKFFLVKPPDPVDHNFDGSSKKFNLKHKIFKIFEDIINF